MRNIPYIAAATALFMAFADPAFAGNFTLVKDKYTKPEICAKVQAALDAPENADLGKEEMDTGAFAIPKGSDLQWVPDWKDVPIEDAPKYIQLYPWPEELLHPFDGAHVTLQSKMLHVDERENELMFRFKADPEYAWHCFIPNVGGNYSASLFDDWYSRRPCDLLLSSSGAYQATVLDPYTISIIGTHRDNKTPSTLYVVPICTFASKYFGDDEREHWRKGYDPITEGRRFH